MTILYKKSLGDFMSKLDICGRSCLFISPVFSEPCYPEWVDWVDEPGPGSAAAISRGVPAPGPAVVCFQPRRCSCPAGTRGSRPASTSRGAIRNGRFSAVHRWPLLGVHRGSTTRASPPTSGTSLPDRRCRLKCVCALVSPCRQPFGTLPLNPPRAGYGQTASHFLTLDPPLRPRRCN